MEECPNCGTQVAAAETRCPTCGLPRNLPLYDAAGTVVGTTFGPRTGTGPPSSLPPVTAGYGATPTTEPTGAAGSAATAGSAGARSASSSRTVLMVVGALAVALVLGIVVAIVVNAVVLAPSRGGTTPPAGQGTPPGSTGPTPPSTGPSGSSSSIPPPVDEQALLAKVRSGIVTVVASTCSPADWSGLATGFLVNATTVVTSWSGVAEAVAVVVTGPDGQPVPARVVKADKVAGVAVLETSRPMAGTPIQPAAGTLAAGQRWHGVHADALRDRAAALLPVGIGAPGKGSLGEAVLQQAALTDVAAGDFAAGGPLVNPDGQVVGLLARYPDSDVLLAIGVDQLQRVLSSGKAPGAGSCATPLGPQHDFVPRSGANAVLGQYFTAINSGNYSGAWTLLAAKIRGSEEAAAKGWNSTYDFNVVISDLGGGRVRAEFDSIFAAGRGPEPGMTCARWGIVYTIKDGTITAARADRGAKGYVAC